MWVCGWRRELMMCFIVSTSELELQILCRMRAVRGAVLMYPKLFVWNCSISSTRHWGAGLNQHAWASVHASRRWEWHPRLQAREEMQHVRKAPCSPHLTLLLSILLWEEERRGREEEAWAERKEAEGKVEKDEATVWEDRRGADGGESRWGRELIRGRRETLKEGQNEEWMYRGKLAFYKGGK